MKQTALDLRDMCIYADCLHWLRRVRGINQQMIPARTLLDCARDARPFLLKGGLTRHEITRSCALLSLELTWRDSETPYRQDIYATVTLALLEDGEQGTTFPSGCCFSLYDARYITRITPLMDRALPDEVREMIEFPEAYAAYTALAGVQ
jgi:hypothetical protein